MFYINKILPPLIIFLTGSCLSTAAISGISPFKKEKTLEFGPEIQWQSGKPGVTKSGISTERNDRYYYHLSINEKRLSLRLTKNDTSNEASSLTLDSLDILDIFVNNERLPIFQWCLDNRINDTPYKVLNRDTPVKNNTCTVDTRNGEIVVNLDSESRSQIALAKTLSIDIKPGKYISHLKYDMKGFNQKLEEFNLSKLEPAKPAKPQVTAVEQKKNIIKKSPAISSRKKPALCYAKAPERYAKKIDPISYPCSNNTLKNHAKKSINDQVSRKKQALKLEKLRIKEEEELRLTNIELQRLEKLNRKNELETSQRELQWKQKDASLWVGRCMRHWNRGVSPCYCQPYIKSAPVGTQDTCKKKNYTQLTQE